jgi:cell division protein FtsX
MSARDRLFATISIWVTFMIMSIVLFDKATGQYPSNISALTLIVIMVLICLAAVSGTFAVWRHWSREDPCEKQKRSQSRRVARLVEKLDDDDMRDLEALLVSRENLSDYRQRH